MIFLIVMCNFVSIKVIITIITVVIIIIIIIIVRLVVRANWVEVEPVVIVD